MYISLEKIKHHINVDNNFKEDDCYIISLYHVAEEVVQRHIDYDLNKIAEDNNGELPASLQHAILLFIGDMYANRESVTTQNITKIPFSYDYILSLWQNYYPSNFKTEI